MAFGDSGVIHLNEVEKPVPLEDEVLIRVAAVSVNPMEIKFRTGAVQQQMPVELPYIPGLDVAGTIEAVGSKVSRLKTGAHVFATNYGGTYAQYVALKEDHVGLMPNTVEPNEAAALAIPLVTAYTFLVDGGQLQKGQRVLIHGASGGVGSVVLQTAKALGAYVIGTATGEGVSLARSLGADEVIDYKAKDFSLLVKDIDLVVDFAGGDTLNKSFSVVKQGGKLLSAVEPPSEELAKQFNITAKFLTSNPSYNKLDFGCTLVEQGKIKPRIIKLLTLKDTAKAQDMLSAGGLNGKIVLIVS